MSKKVVQLLREARGKEANDFANETPLRPGYPERVLAARDNSSRKKRQVRAVILSGSLAGAALSVTVAALVSQQVHEQRIAEASQVWEQPDNMEGGVE
jgi:hypothetical protein